MSDNLRPFPGNQKIQTFDVSEEILNTIQSSFQKLSAIKSLIQDLENNTSDFVFNKLIEQYTNAKIEHDGNFKKLESELNVQTQPHQSWNIDFNNKKAQLIG